MWLRRAALWSRHTAFSPIGSILVNRTFNSYLLEVTLLANNEPMGENAICLAHELAHLAHKNQNSEFVFPFFKPRWLPTPLSLPKHWEFNLSWRGVHLGHNVLRNLCNPKFTTTRQKNKNNLKGGLRDCHHNH